MLCCRKVASSISNHTHNVWSIGLSVGRNADHQLSHNHTVTVWVGHAFSTSHSILGNRDISKKWRHQQEMIIYFKNFFLVWSPPEKWSSKPAGCDVTHGSGKCVHSSPTIICHSLQWANSQHSLEFPCHFFYNVASTLRVSTGICIWGECHSHMCHSHMPHPHLHH